MQEERETTDFKWMCWKGSSAPLEMSWETLQQQENTPQTKLVFLMLSLASLAPWRSQGSEHLGGSRLSHGLGGNPEPQSSEPTGHKQMQNEASVIFSAFSAADSRGAQRGSEGRIWSFKTQRWRGVQTASLFETDQGPSWLSYTAWPLQHSREHPLQVGGWSVQWWPCWTAGMGLQLGLKSSSLAPCDHYSLSRILPFWTRQLSDHTVSQMMWSGSPVNWVKWADIEQVSCTVTTTSETLLFLARLLDVLDFLFFFFLWPRILKNWALVRKEMKTQRVSVTW